MLIYAAGDTFGGIGGLLKVLDEPDFFNRIIKESLKRIRFCSEDPGCKNTRDLDDYFSESSCFACLQIPDNACSYRNYFLDRKSIGINDVGSYFEGLK